MYFIKYQPLKEQLRERTFTDRDGLPYYVISVAFTTFFIGIPLKTSDGIDALSACIGTAIAIVGTIYSYKKNGGSTGYDFIQKSIVLSWVLLFRCGLPLFLSRIVVGIFTKKVLGLPLGTRSWIDIVLFSVIMAIYYQRLGRHIQDTNRGNSEQSAGAEIASLPAQP